MVVHSNKVRLWLGAICLSLCLLASSSAVAQDDSMREAQTALQEGRFADAAKAFKAIVEEDGENENAVFMLGYSLHMSGKIEEALKYHKMAAESESFGPIATYNIGCAYALLGDQEKALSALEKALEVGFNQTMQFEEDSDLDSLRTSPRFAVLVAKANEETELADSLKKAQELLQDNSFEEAAELYVSLADKHKDNGFVLYRAGYALHASGKLDEAIEYHKRAAKLSPFAAIGNYNLGCALALQEKTEEAITALTKCVDAGFSNVSYMTNDSDLESLKENEKFVALIKRMEEKSEKKSKDSTDKEWDKEKEDSNGK